MGREGNHTGETGEEHRTIGLTACSKSKRGGPDDTRTLAAKDRYDSWLFDGRVRALKAHCDDWAIFSGKFGFLRPDDEIGWYDQELANQPDDTQRELATDVAENVAAMGADEVLILMGRAYAEPLKDAIGDDIAIRDPLEGVGLFDQREALEQLAEAGAATSQAELGDLDGDRR